MHGIVSTDTEGVTTTELPVAFHIRTPHRCIDGSELHIIISLGTNVSVNFILSHYWMIHIGSVLDYGSNQLCVPLQDDLHNLRLTYCAPHNSVRYPDLRSSCDIVFMALPNIKVLLSVMTAFNPNSPWLGSAHDMVRILQSSASTGIPPIPAFSKFASSFSCK